MEAKEKYKNPSNPLYKRKSHIDGYEFPYPFMDNKTFAIESGYKGIKLIKFWLRIKLDFLIATKKLKETIKKKECFYGPFKGEFGHFTAHNLPFLVYLHKKGVKIHYCGMELHKPFLVDESGQSIIHSFYPLRDFFAEVTPNTNVTIPPKDVQVEINKFYDIVNTSNLPFWNIGNDFYYWFIHRHWILNGYTDIYDLSKVYKTQHENSCVIFPRSKGPKVSHNNGGEWDYDKIIDTIKPYFEKIYICGHPSQVLEIKPQDKVELRITADNRQILEACSNAKLIITQHSGVNNLGEYANCQVLIIYNGGNKVEDIGSMNNTLKFRKGLKQKYPLKFAFSYEEIEQKVKENLGIQV